MKTALRLFTGRWIILLIVLLIGIKGESKAQLVTNGGFESSGVGNITTTGTKGWVIVIGSDITVPPVFEIVSDTVEEGSRALKVTVHSVGTNQYDIQIVADSIPVIPGVTYTYSIWAKSTKPGATVNFTTGNYSYSEYGAIRPATLSTLWQQYTMQFTITDGKTVIRAPIHFYGTVDTANSIYIDNLQLVDPNANKRPVIVEAESGVRGSSFPILQDTSATFVDVNTNSVNTGNPGDTSRVITLPSAVSRFRNIQFFCARSRRLECVRRELLLWQRVWCEERCPEQRLDRRQRSCNGRILRSGRLCGWPWYTRNRSLEVGQPYQELLSGCKGKFFHRQQG